MLKASKGLILDVLWKPHFKKAPNVEWLLRNMIENGVIPPSLWDSYGFLVLLSPLFLGGWLSPFNTKPFLVPWDSLTGPVPTSWTAESHDDDDHGLAENLQLAQFRGRWLITIFQKSVSKNVSGWWSVSKNWELSGWSSFSPKHAILGTQVLGKATQKTPEDILKWSSNSSDTRIDDHLELLKRQHVAATFKMIQNSYTYGVYGFSPSYGFLACTTNGTRPNPLRALATKVKYSDRTRVMITSTIDAALWSLTKPQHSKSWEVYQHDGGIVTYHHVQVHGVLVIQLDTHTCTYTYT